MQNNVFCQFLMNLFRSSLWCDELTFIVLWLIVSIIILTYSTLMTELIYIKCIQRIFLGHCLMLGNLLQSLGDFCVVTKNFVLVCLMSIYKMQELWSWLICYFINNESLFLIYYGMFNWFSVCFLGINFVFGFKLSMSKKWASFNIYLNNIIIVSS